MAFLHVLVTFHPGILEGAGNKTEQAFLPCTKLAVRLVPLDSSSKGASVILTKREGAARRLTQAQPLLTTWHQDSFQIRSLKAIFQHYGAFGGIHTVTSEHSCH